MPKTWPELIDALDFRYLLAFMYVGYMDEQRLAAAVDWAAGEHIAAQWHLIVAVAWGADAIDKLCGHGIWGDYNYLVPEMFHRCDPTEQAEFDMSALLSAMLTADPDEIQQFVGITDAYMQSIWNRPYSREFFAALGRGFMEWP